MNCDHPGCGNNATSHSVLGSFCKTHWPAPSLIVKADTRWREQWWNKLTESERTALIDATEGALQQIIARLGHGPPDNIDLMLPFLSIPQVD